MVEKVFISPNRVRAYGNIVNMKTGDDFTLVNSELTVTTDTVDGAEMTVFMFDVGSGILISLVSSAASVYVGESVLLTATVMDGADPVEAAEVTFKLGETVLGTDETDANGVATYTYTTTTSGSLSFSASYQTSTSNSVSVAVNKLSTSTSLSLGSASIVVGGSTTASATVTSSSSGVSGLTVTFKDGTTILGTATTDSTGVATYTLSGLGVGSHSITAVVTGTDVYDTSTSSASALTVLDHSYSISFSQSSYVATGGSATLECTLLEDNVAKTGASVTVTGSDGSVYNGITNTNGIATFNLTGLSSSATYTCTYQNVSDTCIVNVTTYLFYDGGVTGNYNTDYTKSNSGVTATVSTTGTNIKCSTYKDSYYKANVVLSGDFEIQYNLVQKTNDSGGFALLDNTTSSVIDYVEFVNSSTMGTSNSTYPYSNYTSESIVKVTRVGSTLTLYLDDVLIGSKPVSTVDCVFGWKTHSAGGRNFTFKELKIF